VIVAKPDGEVPTTLEHGVLERPLWVDADGGDFGSEQARPARKDEPPESFRESNLAIFPLSSPRVFELVIISERLGR